MRYEKKTWPKSNSQVEGVRTCTHHKHLKGVGGGEPVGKKGTPTPVIAKALRSLRRVQAGDGCDCWVMNLGKLQPPQPTSPATIIPVVLVLFQDSFSPEIMNRSSSRMPQKSTILHQYLMFGGGKVGFPWLYSRWWQTSWCKWDRTRELPPNVRCANNLT